MSDILPFDLGRSDAVTDFQKFGPLTKSELLEAIKNPFFESDKFAEAVAYQHGYFTQYAEEQKVKSV